jgi:hypothetical protein
MSEKEPPEPPAMIPHEELLRVAIAHATNVKWNDGSLGYDISRSVQRVVARVREEEAQPLAKQVGELLAENAQLKINQQLARSSYDRPICAICEALGDCPPDERLSDADVEKLWQVFYTAKHAILCHQKGRSVLDPANSAFDGTSPWGDLLEAVDVAGKIKLGKQDRPAIAKSSQLEQAEAQAASMLDLATRAIKALGKTPVGNTLRDYQELVEELEEADDAGRDLLSEFKQLQKSQEKLDLLYSVIIAACKSTKET